MKWHTFRWLATASLLACGCGDQTPPPSKPVPPAAVEPVKGPDEPAPPQQGCTAPPKQCAGGVAPTIDPSTCAQTCPGE